MSNLVFSADSADGTFLYSRKGKAVNIFPQVDRDFVFDFASCLFMEKMYVTGGWYYRRDCESAVCNVYDPKTDLWGRLQNMLVGRNNHSCVAFAGKIVVTGGMESKFNSVEAYDHFADEWKLMPDLSEVKSCHGSVAMGNKLYVVAGVDTQNSEVFDFVSNKFVLIKPFPLKYNSDQRRQFEYFRVRKEIIVKYDGNEADDNIYVYNTIGDKWSSVCVEFLKEHSVNYLHF